MAVRWMMAAAMAAAAAMLMAPAGASAAVTQQTTTECRWTLASDETEYWCNVGSAAYPNQSGPYGFVGSRTDVCSGRPRGTAENLLKIACLRVPTVSGYKWEKGRWSEVQIPHETRGWLVPFGNDWRLLWANGAYYAVNPADVFIEWRVSQRPVQTGTQAGTVTQDD